MRLEPVHALLNNPPLISAKIPSHIWDSFSGSLESLLSSPSSFGLPLSGWTVLYRFGSLLCLWEHMGQCRMLGTKKIHALPLFWAPCLRQVDGPEDWTDSTGTKGRYWAGTHYLDVRKYQQRYMRCHYCGKPPFSQGADELHLTQSPSFPFITFLGLFWNK